MTEEQIALARRAVACKGWRWMPGMLASGFRVCRVDPHGYRFGWSDSSYAYRIADDVLPDLDDPATLGCLLALVREAVGDQEAYAVPWHDDEGGWTVVVNDEDGTHNIAQGDTEIEALIDALEAAP